MPGVSKRYVVRLTLDERVALEQIVSKGTVAAQKRRHASILLVVDEGKHGPAMSDAEAAEATGVTSRTVERVRIRCVNDGLELALQRKPRTRERTARLDGEAEARLVQIACSGAPEGRARWMMRLLSARLVELASSAFWPDSVLTGGLPIRRDSKPRSLHGRTSATRTPSPRGGNSVQKMRASSSLICTPQYQVD